MSQDQARDWLKQQVQSFCGKYPKDQNCYWPKKEDKTEGKDSDKE
jgi:hypothetical protein